MKTTTQPLRCLLVEDVEDDAKLILRELRASGYVVTSERVDTPEAMRAALERAPWDLVISDFSMPRFSGLDALKLLQASGHDLPFILVSGTMGEETAVNAMRAGAHDYLLKDNLARLGPAVERELGSAAQRRERAAVAAALRENQALLTQTEALGKVGGWEFDTETKQQTWTDAVYAIHELDRAVHPTVSQGVNFYMPESQPIIARAVQRAIELGEPFDVELEIITAKGNRRSVHAVGQADPTHRKVSGFIQDITARKRAEAALRKSEARLNFALQQIMTGAWDLDLRDHTASRTLIHDQIFGYKTLLPEWTYEMFLEHVLPEDRAEVDRLFGQATAAQTDWNFECRIRRSDGEVRWIRAAGGHERSSEDKPIRMAGIVQDITVRKQAEAVDTFLANAGSRPEAEPFFAALARFLATNLQMDYICIDRLEGDALNATTLAVWHNGRFEDNLTYALKDTPCGKVVENKVCCYPASVSRFFPNDAALQELRAESYVGVTLFSHTGQPIGLIAVIGRHPLTDRARAEATLARVAPRAAGELERLTAEAALARSTELLEMTGALTKVGGWEFDLQTNRHSWSRETYRIYDLDPAVDPTLESGLNYYAPEGRTAVAAAVQAATDHGTPYDLEVPFISAKGRHLWVRTKGNVVMGKGRAIKLYGTFQDITERKEAEAALRTSEHQYRELFESASDALLLLTGDTGQIIDANRMATVLYGYERAELLTKQNAELSAEPEETARRTQEALSHPGQIFNIPLRLHRKKDGTIFPVEITARSLLHQGKLALLVACRDITERKKAEAARREDEERHRTILQAAQDGFWVVDDSGRLVEVNEAYSRMSGYSGEELLGRRIPDLEATETAAATTEHMQRIRRQGTDRFETKHRRKDGSVYDVEVSVQVRSSEAKGFVAFVHDITARKQAEAALRLQAEELHRRNETLRRFNDAVVGREIRMIELKQEVNELCGKLCEPPRFRVPTSPAPAALETGTPP